MENDSQTNPSINPDPTMEVPASPCQAPVAAEAAPQATAADCRKFESIRGAVDAARQDAGRIAGESAPKIKNAVKDVAHDLAYGAAFGVCFAAAFARELAPGALKDGLARGATAGREAAKRARESFREGTADAAHASVDLTPSAG